MGISFFFSIFHVIPLLRGDVLMDERKYVRTDITKFTPVSYGTSALWGCCPKKGTDGWTKKPTDQQTDIAVVESRSTQLKSKNVKKAHHEFAYNIEDKCHPKSHKCFLQFSMYFTGVHMAI